MAPSTWMDDLQGPEVAEAEAQMRLALKNAAGRVALGHCDMSSKKLTPIEAARARRSAIREEMNAMLRRQGFDC